MPDISSATATIISNIPMSRSIAVRPRSPSTFLRVSAR
jgi:hypothetical protein